MTPFATRPLSAYRSLIVAVTSARAAMLSLPAIVPHPTDPLRSCVAIRVRQRQRRVTFHARQCACLFSIICQDPTRFDFDRQTEVNADPLRLIEGVTAGMALLAAGIIFASGG
ncbi:hypothetical protein [uncultured Jannaschia sp.]|uniref:hypothetical protein n=1 Tax=uncultured Jannaschia sp. TaxID=293347 RepID=UPI002618FFAD|nr:hypothetical protein [uncultured Jannaschia sp.]